MTTWGGAIFLPATLALCVSAPALGWNGAGHRLSACVAWQNLDPIARNEVVRLLRQHPDRSRWQTMRTKDPSGRLEFVEASTWPDDIRGDRRYDDSESAAARPRVPGVGDMARHLDWHYVNRPVRDSTSTRPARQHGVLDRQLVRISGELAAATTADAQRSYALPWFIHLLGDAHQPLHTIDGLPNRDGRGYTSAGALRVVNPFAKKARRPTLHAFWDDLPGPSWLRGRALEERCLTMTRSIPPPRPLPAKRSTRIEAWITESWTIAQRDAYPPVGAPTPVITREFLARSQAIADTRIAYAGYRLAELLNESFKRVRRAGELTAPR